MDKKLFEKFGLSDEKLDKILGGVTVNLFGHSFDSSTIATCYFMKNAKLSALLKEGAACYGVDVAGLLGGDTAAIKGVSESCLNAVNGVCNLF